MKTNIIILLITLLSTTLTIQTRKHQFLDLSANPLKTAQVMSGDYAAILPEFLQPLARKLLGTEKQTGPAGFLQNAQGLLNGGDPLSQLMGGQPAGNGLASILGGGQSNNSGGLGSLLSGFTGGQSNNSGGGLSSLLGGGGSSTPSSGLSGLLGGIKSPFGHHLRSNDPAQ